MIKKTFDSFKKGFQPIIEPMQWRTELERHAAIERVLAMKRFPLKEVLDALENAYTITDRKKKAELLQSIEEILVRSPVKGFGDNLLQIYRITSDPEIRETTIQILINSMDDTLIGSVISLLRSPKRNFRLTAIKLFEKVPQEKVAGRVAQELVRGEWTDRVDALNLLFNLDQSLILPPCVRTLEVGNEEDKIQAIKLLMLVKTPESVQAMTKVITDESIKIRMQVAKAFAKVGGPIAVDGLVKLAADSKPDVVLTALDGLRELKSPAGITAVLACVRHENLSIRNQALNAIGEIGSADEVEFLVSALKDPDIRVRQTALDALISLSNNEDTDIPRFISILMSDPDVNVRRAAAQILGQVDAPGIFDKLFQYLRDEDWWVRETIAETLSRIKDERIFPAAVELLGSPDPSLRRYAIEIIVGLKDPRGLVPLIKMLKDPDWWVRERAVSALGTLGTAKIVPILANLLTIKELSYITAEALGEIGDASAVPFLLKAIDTADVETKLVIMRSLEKLQAKEAIPVLESMVADPSREIRAQSKEVLARLKVDTGNLDKVSARWWERHEFSLLDTLLLEVRYRHGTDLFIVSDNPPMAKVVGELIPLTSESLSEEQILTMTSRILTPDQEAQFFSLNDLDFSYEIADEGRFRGNMFRHALGINMTFRLLPDDIPELETLGLPSFVDSVVSMHHGLILIAGPSACGKSTTAAAIINKMNQSRNDHIIMIEDPVEYLHDRKNCLITQREVGRHTASFAKALRASLREDPDVIVIGELRDLETISMALTAAETGHLVLATLHSMSAIKAIDRIIDAFPPSQQGQIRSMLAESLKVILAQQLIPRKNSDEHVVAMEILVNTPAIAGLIRDNKLNQIASMIIAGQQHGMVSMDQTLLNLLREGVITADEAYSRAEEKNQFEVYLKDIQEKH